MAALLFLGPLDLMASDAKQNRFGPAVLDLIDQSCIGCHDKDTDTNLNFESVSSDLSNRSVFKTWERIFDRVSRGEMPPSTETPPTEASRDAALAILKDQLNRVSLRIQARDGRVSLRRLTPLEFENSLHDLLAIRSDLKKHLPPENSNTSYDTVANGQGISMVHVRSYLAAAEEAIDEAIELRESPYRQPVKIDYRNSPYVKMWLDRPLRNGGSTLKMVGDDFVTFEKRCHQARSDHMGFRPQYAGMYRITAEAYGYNAKTPVTMNIYRSSEEDGIAKLVGYFDLLPGATRKIQFTTYLRTNDYFYPSIADDDWGTQSYGIYTSKDGAKTYDGEGLGIKWLKIQGPLEQQWPPKRTRRVMAGAQIKPMPLAPRPWRPFTFGRSEPRIGFTIAEPENPQAQLTSIIKELGKPLFGRPLTKPEVDGFASLATEAIASGEAFENVIRSPLRALFTAPQFLFRTCQPGQLDDYALASRLSYFLWKSIPDQQLLRLAKDQRLSDPQELKRQVDRMLNDRKAERFVNDFLDQWLNLAEIDATKPDDKLYPEYDDNLRQSMLRETRLFFRELIVHDLSVRNLIDSDFTMLNRRLGVHYEIGGLSDERFHRVNLPAASVRGGLITQASILKVTANGTVTSPVRRGNYVLAKLLGTPPSPPPPDIGSIEPDTRGATTIRQILNQHRNVQACASCHKHIDPPGFALESFDPIGGFRIRYRSSGKGDFTHRRIHGRTAWEYREGPPVDASGNLPDGRSFADVRQFKHHLMSQVPQVARNLVAQLVIYSTGAEIQFADRQRIDEIVDACKDSDYGVRSLLHAVVQSDLFRNK